MSFDIYKCPTCSYRDDGPEIGISLHFNKQLNPDWKDITRLCPACLFKLIAEKVLRMEKEEVSPVRSQAQLIAGIRVEEDGGVVLGAPTPPVIFLEHGPDEPVLVMSVAEYVQKFGDEDAEALRDVYSLFQNGCRRLSVAKMPAKEQQDPMTEPRAYTASEVEEDFLAHVRALCHYWATLKEPKTLRERCNGLAFSILTLLDGEHMEFPAVDLVLHPHPEDEAYHREQGENWYEAGMVFNQGALHELFYRKEPS